MQGHLRVKISCLSSKRGQRTAPRACRTISSDTLAARRPVFPSFPRLLALYRLDVGYKKPRARCTTVSQFSTLVLSPLLFAIDIASRRLRAKTIPRIPFAAAAAGTRIASRERLIVLMYFILDYIYIYKYTCTSTYRRATFAVGLQSDIRLRYCAIPC